MTQEELARLKALAEKAPLCRVAHTELTASAVESIPALIAEVERLRKALKELLSVTPARIDCGGLVGMENRFSSAVANARAALEVKS